MTYNLLLQDGEPQWSPRGCCWCCRPLSGAFLDLCCKFTLSLPYTSWLHMKEWIQVRLEPAGFFYAFFIFKQSSPVGFLLFVSNNFTFTTLWIVCLVCLVVHYSHVFLFSFRVEIQQLACYRLTKGEMASLALSGVGLWPCIINDQNLNIK